MQSNRSISIFFVKHAGLIAVIALTFLFTSWFYGGILFNPGQYIFNDSGDAIKNYFCYEWHVHHDTSFINYTGTNYPFGENYGYTDGNPLLSSIVKLFPCIASYSIPLFNLSLLFSFFLCAILLFKIFKEFNVEDWFAVIASVGITILCPQGLRLSGHFNLAYGFAIPLVIYLSIRYERNPGIKYSLYIFLSSICLLFIHPYLGMIADSFLLLYWLFKILFAPDKLRSYSVPFVVQAIVPLLFYFLFTKLTDTHTGRIGKPYGFFHFIASIETVFISTHKPFRHFLSQIYPIREQNQEGIAYTGIASLFCFFYLAFMVIKKRKRLKTFYQSHPRVQSYCYMALSAFVLLLFSMGYPFKWNMQWILDYIPFLQQFRAPGRFAWVFYFIATIGATLVVTKYFIIGLNKKIRWLACTLLILLFTVEGLPYHQGLSKKLIVKNIFNENCVNLELKPFLVFLKEKKAQAIIPLPFFHIGTDYYNIPGTEKIINAALILSYHCKIPLMAGLTPRNSLTEADQLIQITSNDLIEREVRSKITSPSSFFILYSKEKLAAGEKTLLAKSKTVMESPNFVLREVTPELLTSTSAKEQGLYFKKNGASLFYKDRFFLSRSSYFKFYDFDSLREKEYVGNAAQSNTLIEIPANTLDQNIEYEVSFWYRTRDRLDLDNILIISERSADSPTRLAEKNIKSMSDIANQKSLAVIGFKPVRSDRAIVIELLGISDREKVFYVDDLMIREKGVSAYKSFYSPALQHSILNVNNIPVQLK